MSKDDFDLIQAEAVLDFLVDKIKKCKGEVAEAFHVSLQKKLEERRNSTLTALLMYLHNPENWNMSEHFSVSTKNSIHVLGISLLKRLFGEQEAEASSTMTTQVDDEQDDEDVSCEGKLFGQLKKQIGIPVLQPHYKKNADT